MPIMGHARNKACVYVATVVTCEMKHAAGTIERP